MLMLSCILINLKEEILCSHCLMRFTFIHDENLFRIEVIMNTIKVVFWCPEKELICEKSVLTTISFFFKNLLEEPTDQITFDKSTPVTHDLLEFIYQEHLWLQTIPQSSLQPQTDITKIYKLIKACDYLLINSYIQFLILNI